MRFVTSTLWILRGLALTALVAVPVGADVTGTVFRDFDGDGARDAGEPGIAGVTIESFDASGSLGTTSTASDGTYAVVGGAASEEVRVEARLPGSLDFLYAGVTGANSDTTLTFVTLPGDGSDATGVDFAFVNPAQHCQADPNLVTPCYVEGDQSGMEDVLVSFGNTFSGENPTPEVGHEAVASDIGSVWGLAYSRSADLLFAGSFLKRHAGFGDGAVDGTGVIWVVDDPDDDTPGGAEFVNLNDLYAGNPFGDNPHPTGSDFNLDAATYAEVGKRSFGDLDLSEDELTLWAINLADRRLYEISLGSDPENPVAPASAADVDRHDLFDLADCDGDGSDDTSSDVDLRPFALKVHDGSVYVGAVCSAESTDDVNDLRALVFRFDPDTDVFTQVLSFDLDYFRGCLLFDNVPPECVASPSGDSANWSYWEDAWPPADLVNMFGGGEYGYPQPILSDLEFDPDGTLLLGFRDRFGDQMGADDPPPDNSADTNGDGLGDLLRALPDGMGGFTASTVEATEGTEYFADDDWNDTRYFHPDVVQGGLAVVAGSGEVVASTIDPVAGTAPTVNDFSAGIRWFDVGTGATSRRYEIYDVDTAVVDVFGKANGLGDVEVICEPAPLELGNRIWCDDGDGVQDPGESGIGGVTVTLLCDTDGSGLYGDGTDLTATTVTAGDGTYVFGDGNVAGGVPIRTDCRLQVSRTALNGSCGPVVTATLRDASSGVGSDLRDSDATRIAGDLLAVDFTTGLTGANDHTLDFGVTPSEPDPPGSLGIEKTVSPSGPVTAGATLTYTVTVTNDTGATVDGVEVTDVLPPGVTYVAESTAATGPVVLPVFRVTEYFLGTGDFTGTTYDLTLDQDLADDYFVIVQGSDGDGGGTRVPSQNYARLTADPAGTGDLASSGSTDVLSFGRDAAVDAWVGVVTVVECLNACGIDGFRLVDVQEVTHAGTAASGSDTVSGSWTLSRVLLMGGFNGAGCSTAAASSADHPVCHARFVPSGTNTIGWTRGTGSTLSTATSTVMAVEWGTAWTVERTRVTGNNGGNGLDDTGEYNTASIGSVDRDRTWVWGTGFTDDNGIGNAAEGAIVTLGDGVSQNAIETSVAVGTEFNNTAVDFEVWALSHPDLAVDYRFKADGDSGSLTVDVPVDPAGSERMALSYNGQNGGGTAYPRPLFSARYLDASTVRLERRRSGQNFPAWVQGIDFTDVEFNGAVTFDNDPVSVDGDLYDGAPPNLVEPADGFLLANGESLTVTFEVTVDSPATVSSIENLAVASAFGVLPATDTVVSLVATAVGILGDFVWFDLDGDGVQDPAEPGIEGAVVNLHAGSGCAGPVIESTVTDSNGLYFFDGLGAGDYCVEVYEGSLPEGYGATNANPRTTTLPAGGTDASLDFGFDAAACLPDIGFETDALGDPLLAGQVIDDEHAPWGVTFSVAAGGTGAAFDELMVFDTNNPSGGDTDLGSPHEDFGGPGIGAGGAAGEPFENRFDLDHVLVISTDGDETDPNDEAVGGVITVSFDRDREVDEISFLDSGNTVGVDGGEIRLYDAGAVQIGAGIPIPGSGDNGAVAVSGIGGAGVRSVEIELFGGGAVDEIVTCALPRRVGRIGDRVWLDVDRDGVQDVGEPGLSNVELTVWDAGADMAVGGGDDTAVATVRTGAFGGYLFPELPAGFFYVDVTDATVPSGLALTVGSSDPSAVVALPSGGSDLTVDFGYGNPSAADAVVGDTVWIDTDADGVLDPGEPGAAGVTLDLRSAGADGVLGTADDVVEDTTTTVAGGRYLFIGVVPGEYVVDVTDTGGVLTGYTLTTGPQSVSDPSPPFAVAAGGAYLRADFGYDPGGAQTLTERFWYDADGDGVQDPGEEGLAGVTVELLDASGDVIASATSDTAGDVTFDGLGSGDHTVRVTDVAGVLTLLDATTSPAALASLGVTLSGAGYSGVSFGYNRPGVLGDRVWSDADGDGVQDPREAGIAGVTVELYYDVDGDGVLSPGTDTLVATAVTDALGRYLFEGLFPGTYFASIDDGQAALSGYTHTTADVEPATGDQLQAALAEGTSYLGADFGYQNTSLADISGNVFEDLDRDGVDDGAGEPGFEAVTLELRDASGNVLATTSTDAAGDYAFPDLPAGDYTVAVVDAGGVLADTTLTSGLDEIDVTLAASDVGGVDFGYARDSQTATWGDFVWLDADGDGQQEGAEDGIAGVTVELYDPGPDLAPGGGDDALVATAVTDALGRYRVKGLPAGPYYAQVDTATLPGGGASLVATTANPSTVVDLAEGEAYLDADFGFGSAPGVGAIGDFVWFDADGDAVQDPGEIGIAGVEIELTGPGCAPCVAVTEADGSYLFAGLAPGDYSLIYDPSTVPSLYASTATNNDGDWELMLAAGDAVATADYGFPAAGATASVGDTVFLDSDGDGLQGAGEPGIPGVTLDLLNAAGTAVLASTVTDASGGYDFLGLAAGTYRVRVSDVADVLAGLGLTAGTNPTAAIVLAAAEDYDDADFPYAPSPGSGSIGNRVWRDLDGDGGADPGEPGVEGVSVDLWLDVNGNGVLEPGVDNRVRTEVTDSRGLYEFRGLALGDYLVDVTDTAGVLAGFTKTTGTAGTDDNSQADPYAVTLSVGADEDVTADFGYFAAADLTIAGKAFFDQDGDGAIDPVDVGVEVVTVFLFRDLDGDGVLDGDDALIDFVDTDADGDYLFTNLPPGDYLVAVDATGTFVDGGLQTTQLLSAGVEPVTLVAVDSMDHDFGFTRAATLALMASLRAELAETGGLLVRWTTSSEAGTAGFHLWRRDADGGFVPLTDVLVPSPPGAPQGAAYRVLDPHGGAPGEIVEYALVEIQRQGRDLVHGPYAVTVEPAAETGTKDRPGSAPRPVSERMVERIVDHRVEKLHPDGATGRKAAESLDRLKARVTTTGLQFLGAEAIAETLGRTLDEIRGLISTNGLRLDLRGQTVATFAADDGLYFFGRAPDADDLFRAASTYRLELAPGLAMAEDPTTVAAGVEGAFEDGVHHEENVFAATFVARDPDLDYWHWKGLIAGHPTLGEATFELPVADPTAAADAVLTVHLRGAGESPVPFEHHAEVEWNGQGLGDSYFDGLADHVFELAVPSSLLEDGSATVVVRALADTGASSSFFYVDAFELTYERRQRAVNDELLGRFEGSQATVGGFSAGLGASELLALDLSDPLRPIALTGLATTTTAGSDGPAVAASFPRSGSGDRFLVAARAGAARPDLVGDRPSDLLSPSRAGEYLVLTSATLVDAAQGLADLRRSDRRSATVVDVEDVYDELSFGEPLPSAIRDFVTLARERWAEPPRYLVLAGKGDVDYRDLLGLGVDLVPPAMVPTPYGLYASDGYFADGDGDGLPEIAVGRVPVLHAEELDAYVAKLAAYDAADGPWTEKVLLVADNSDEGGTFRRNGDRVRSLLPRGVVERIYVEELGAVEARGRLLDGFHDGASLVNFIGHGGFDRMAEEGLLTTSDALGLTNGDRLPVVAALSCNLSRFELPGFASLGEELTLSPWGGAVAVWAPTGLALDFESHEANRSLARGLGSPLYPTLGDLLGEVLRDFRARSHYEFSAEIYNLLGDPALPAKFPRATTETPAADLSLGLSAGSSGSPWTITAVVENAGPEPTPWARLHLSPVAGIESCAWTCVEGACAEVGPGVFEAELGVGERIVVEGSCELDGAPEAVVSGRAEELSGLAEIDGDNNTGVVTLSLEPGLLFADGFETGDRSAWPLTSSGILGRIELEDPPAQVVGQGL